MLATGALVLLVRKGSGWSDFARLVVILVPCATLFGFGLGGIARRASSARSENWLDPSRSVLITFALLLLPFTLTRLVTWLGGHATSDLNSTWIFTLTAVVAAVIAIRVKLRFAMLLSSLALLIAWLSIWDEIISHPSATTFRGLLIGIGLILILASVVLARRGIAPAGELVTGGGIALVAAGAIGMVGVAISIAGRSGFAGGAAGALGLPQQHLGWDLMLLAIAVALILYGSYSAARGPAYVGAIGLGLFVISVGVQITQLAAGGSRSHSLAGWPLALIVLGVVGLSVGLLTGAPHTDR